MSRRPPFDPDRMAVMTLALATVLLFSIPLFANEVPTVDREVETVGPDRSVSTPSTPSSDDPVTPVHMIAPAAALTEPSPSADSAPSLSIRIHTSTAMPSDAFDALLADIDRWQSVLPVSILVRGLPVRRPASGLAVTDHDRAMPFVEPLAQRNVGVDVDPTVGRALDRAYRAAFPDEESNVEDDVTMPAIEVRVNGLPLETHVGTVNVLAVLARIARPIDNDPDAKAHAETLLGVLSEPAFELLKNAVLERAL